MHRYDRPLLTRIPPCSKAIDINSDNDGDVSFQDVYDIERQNRGPADYDVTHTFSSSWMSMKAR